MTKKKPASGPELPPGQAPFPHWLDGAGSKPSTKPNLTKPDRKRIAKKVAAGMASDEALRELLAEKFAAKLAKPGGAGRYLKALAGEPHYETQARNRKHALRWSRVREMDEMTPDAFKKKHGYKKSLNKIYELVAEAEAEDLGPQAIKKSCDMVDADLETGGRQFLVGDGTTRKLGKKRPRSR